MRQRAESPSDLAPTLHCLMCQTSTQKPGPAKLSNPINLSHSAPPSTKKRHIVKKIQMTKNSAHKYRHIMQKGRHWHTEFQHSLIPMLVTTDRGLHHPRLIPVDRVRGLLDSPKLHMCLTCNDLWIPCQPKSERLPSLSTKGHMCNMTCLRRMFGTLALSYALHPPTSSR
jgi:hypothetical protein